MIKARGAKACGDGKRRDPKLSGWVRVRSAGKYPLVHLKDSKTDLEVKHGNRSK